MADLDLAQLSRLERRIMDALYHLTEGGATEVARRLGDEASFHSIRVTLGNLEKKGLLRHRSEGNRHIYRPAVSPERASRKAVRHLMRTFFAGSPSQAFLALLDESAGELSPEELGRIRMAIDAAREDPA